MPTYDYLCAGCGHRFEAFHSMTAESLRKCPECKQPKLDRLIGAGAGVIFKGSGFYQTDYKNSGSGDQGGPDKTADKGADKAGGKPADKAGDKAADKSPGNGSASSGCAPTCGTKDAPTGCQMGKKKGG